MKILTAAEMAAADQRSVADGVPVWTLMQHAGAAVARFCQRWPGWSRVGRVVVLAGRGNNGGDGMVAALRLAEAGYRVRAVLLGEAAALQAEPARAWATLQSFAQEHPGIVELVEVSTEAALAHSLEDAALVLDAIVGTGFQPPLRGFAASAVALLAARDKPVVAVDLPSGWDADAMALSVDGAMRADAVVTFVAPKRAHVFGHLTPGKVFGPVLVAPIGESAGAVQSAAKLAWAGAAKSVAEQPRAIDSNKGRFGHVLIVGGALGKAGAPSMSSLAAMRAGAGLVTAAVPREVLATVAAVAPEMMLTPLESDAEGGLSLTTLEPDALAALLKGIDVLGVGPGLGQVGDTPEFVRRLVAEVELPMVLDADALNAFAGKTELLRAASVERVRVLTPHPGEMARLLGLTVRDVEADRVGVARRFATEMGVTLVLKGWRTLIAHPDGRVAVNTTGNPAMAKGGSGDVLTGIVSAMLAQYAHSGAAEDVARAVEAAVWLHGLAGDFACVAQDEHTVLATDTIAHLWQAFRASVVDADGATWITGLATRD
jgi:NAD(P)H-hydrate epimerase